LKSLSKSNGIVLLLVIAFVFGSIFGQSDEEIQSTPTPAPSVSVAQEPLDIESSEEPSPEESKKPKKVSAALAALDSLPIKGRAPKTGYSREMFADGWEYSFGCDTRNRILRRDFVQYTYRSDSACIIELGVLEDPYTGQTINFQRGVRTSLEVQIDHVVALSDAWQKGAQQLSSLERRQFYNDPLNLLAVSGRANSQKSDSDAASWLPSNKAFRCEFVARQLAVKLKYRLWATQAEHDTIGRILQQCPKQRLPTN